MPVNRSHLKRGVQIAYIPNHADADIGHPDVEIGFVSTVKGSGAFCRYWLRRELWQDGIPELRTKANSEFAPFDNLLIFDSVDQVIVNFAIKAYMEGA